MIPKSIATATLMLLAIGCGPPTDSLEQQLRGQLFQQQRPGNIVSLAEAYEALSSAETVTVCGSIYSGTTDSPFLPDQAAFHFIELVDAVHDHEDPASCPFCRRSLERAATAVVRIVDRDGEIVSRSAEQLLGLKKNQKLVVTGKGELIGDLLVINATGIHLLSADDAKQLSKPKEKPDADS